MANDIRATMQSTPACSVPSQHGRRREDRRAARTRQVGGPQDKSKVFNTARIEALEVENLIECAQATMVSPPPAANAVAPTP